MPQRIFPSILILGVVALVLLAWQPAPALAGFTPTPAPPPTDTPVPPPPTNTPKPPPEKPPKDTPVPTATVNLTATPGVLPVGGGEARDDGRTIAILFLAFIFIAAIEIVVRQSQRGNAS
jgi:hypothetical protein